MLKIKQAAHKHYGFTLLELLLVVGIAAILIVAGITTYNLVTRGNQVNETIRLVNILADQTRRLYGSQNNYGASGANIETALFNVGAIPAKYKDVANAQIISPYSAIANAVKVEALELPAVSLGGFVIYLAVPPALVPEIAAAFDPNKNTNVHVIRYCGFGAIFAGDTFDLSAISSTCGNSTTVPSDENFGILFK